MQILPTSSMSEFVRQYPLKSFKRRETIIFQDDQPSTVYYIKSGFIKGYDIDSQGTEQLLWLGTAGDFCPLSWVFDAEPTIPYFFTAMNDVEAYAVRRTDMKNFLDSNFEALRQVTQSLAVRLINTFHHLNAVEKARAEEKIIYCLYFLANRFTEYAEQPMDKVVLPMTHQDIASLAGVSRETAAQELKKLKERGFIQYNKYCFIIHPEKLATAL
ncbi:MAG TPA: Crp/Fnr family transcriptional regulator [Candidatus Saccharimonadales bacterium]